MDKVFHHVEAFAVQQGRELIRMSHETLTQEQINTFEKRNDTLLEMSKEEKKLRLLKQGVHLHPRDSHSNKTL